MNGQKYKISTATGYGCTGSSAVNDLLKEFSNYYVCDEDLPWILQDFDAISDLEYFLIEGNHRSKTHLAIKKFELFIKKHTLVFERIFGKKFKLITKKYLESITDTRFKKQIMRQEISNFFLRFWIFKVSPQIQRVFYFIKKIFYLQKKTKFVAKFPYVEKTYTIPNKKNFYKNTKIYTNELFKSIGKNKETKHLHFDQLLPAMNSQRYFNYLDNVKVIIVDRDPRDLYILNEEVWKGDFAMCDTSNVHQFINWYGNIRQHRVFEKSNKNTKYINFEDLIYNYEQTINSITKFLEIPRKYHKKKNFFFIPKNSILETKMWHKYPKYSKEMKLIEKKLSKFCYKY
ncbi:hypothetical protein N9481_04040 [Pelagibacteraceae bacterium]|nr:hypothetical protein [Pelagibacteraceae bacterium]